MLQICSYSLFGSVDDSRAYCTNVTVIKYCFEWNVSSSHNNFCLKQKVFLKETWGQNFISFLWYIFVSFKEKGPHTNICNVLASFHEVMKLQRFFWKWHHTHEYTTRFFTGFLCIFLLILCIKILHCQKPLWCFWPFFTNLWSYEILNDITVSRRKWRHPCEWTYIIC